MVTSQVVAVLERGDFHAIVFHAVSKQAVECLGGNRQQEVEIGSAVGILTSYTSDIYKISIQKLHQYFLRNEIYFLDV